MKIAITVGHSILKNGTCTSAKGEVLIAKNLLLYYRNI